jgi:hypothetical protein
MATSPRVTRKAVVLGCLLVTMLAVIGVVPIYGLSPKNDIDRRSRKPHKTVQTVNATIYETGECLHGLTSIDWGIVGAGSSTSVTVYVRNTGNTDVRVFLATDHWYPEYAQTYIYVDWDGPSGKIKSGQVVPMTLTLTVSDDVQNVSCFTFDVVVTSTQATGKRQ